MTRKYDVHVRTLAQVASLIRVDGSFPGPVTITAGWFRARARPWNDEITDPMIRLDRGGPEFLRSVSKRLLDLGAAGTFSPALYPSSAGVWQKSGYVPFAELAVMERSLVADMIPRPATQISSESAPEWDEVHRVDAAAFEGFWRMSRSGLREAHETSRATTLLAARRGGALAGYAIVGNQWGVSYLHRIAVDPAHGGNGVGRSLLESAIQWGRAHGGRSMVLNVRDSNDRAIRLYEKCGFTQTGTNLTVLRHEDRRLLN